MRTSLRDHLIHEHSRAAREIDGLPLAGMHRLEHVEDEMGLLHLHHSHPTDRVVGRARRNGAPRRSRPDL